MVGILINNFTGAMPAKDVRSLPDNAAALSFDQRPNMGGLEPVRQPLLIQALQASTKYVFRIPPDAGDYTDLTQGYWWEFSDPDTDVIRTPNVNDSFQRYYSCSPSQGLRVSTAARIRAGTPENYFVGVVAPTTAPVLTIDSSNSEKDQAGDFVNAVVTRDYVVTFVNQYNEESAPSPAVEGSGPDDAIWNLSSIPQPAADGTRGAPARINLYRTVTGASGETVFNLVVYIPLAQTTYSDTLPDTLVGGQTILPTTNGAVAPDNLSGIALMPNGIVVAFSDKNLYFSDNYQPWSWPAAYTLSVESRIVGLAVIGNTCVVCTTSRPYLLSGSSAAAMSLTAAGMPLPCWFRGSIAVAPEGVYWATADGLALYVPGASAKIITDEIVGRSKWILDYNPRGLYGVYANNSYIGVIKDTGFAFGSGCVIKYGSMAGAIRCGLDYASGQPWYITGALLYQHLPPTTAYKNCVWTSKQFVTPKPVNMGVIQAYFDDTVTGAAVSVRVFGRNGKLRFTGTLADRQAKRMPSSFKDDIWQVEITTNTLLHQIKLAQTVEDLKGQ